MHRNGVGDDNLPQNSVRRTDSSAVRPACSALISPGSHRIPVRKSPRARQARHRLRLQAAVRRSALFHRSAGTRRSPGICPSGASRFPSGFHRPAALFHRSADISRSPGICLSGASRFPSGFHRPAALCRATSVLRVGPPHLAPRLLHGHGRLSYENLRLPGTPLPLLHWHHGKGQHSRLPVINGYVGDIDRVEARLLRQHIVACIWQPGIILVLGKALVQCLQRHSPGLPAFVRAKLVQAVALIVQHPDLYALQRQGFMGSPRLYGQISNRHSMVLLISCHT